MLTEERTALARRPGGGELESMTGERVRTQEVGVPGRAAQALGAVAVGAFAMGALALGALAIGALAVGRLAVGRSRIRRLEIDELVVRRLHVYEVRVTGSLQAPNPSGPGDQPAGPH